MKVTPILLPFDDTEVNRNIYVLILFTVYKHTWIPNIYWEWVCMYKQLLPGYFFSFLKQGYPILEHYDGLLG